MSRILFRVDAGARIGLGHLIRCGALAEILGSDFEPVFVMRSGAELAARYLPHVPVVSIGCDVPIENEVSTILKIAGGPSLLVMDSYALGEAFESAARSAGFAVVCIDDLVAREFAADLVINHCNSSISGRYWVKPKATVLCGPKYAILRRPFLEAALSARKRPPSGGVFLAMGGTDAEGMAPRIVRILGSVPAVGHLHIAAGLRVSQSLALRESLGAFPQATIHEELNPEQLYEVLQRCSLAITSASTIALEVCAIGMPLIAGMVAGNQLLLHAELADRDAAWCVGGWAEAGDEHLRGLVQGAMNPGAFERSVDQQRALVDGQSGQRIRAAFQSLSC